MATDLIHYIKDYSNKKTNKILEVASLQLFNPFQSLWWTHNATNSSPP